MLERDVEKRLVSEVKKRHGVSPKFVSPGTNGMPDRIVLLPNGKIVFVELKAPGKKPRALQLACHKKLRALGFDVFVIDNISQIDEMLESIGGKNDF